MMVARSCLLYMLELKVQSCLYIMTYSSRRTVQGLWTAWYGAHGPEIVHVWFEESLLQHSGVMGHEEPDHLPRPRLVGCKVTGDPNVPANQWTFEAQVLPCMQFSTWHAEESRPGQSH